MKKKIQYYLCEKKSAMTSKCKVENKVIKKKNCKPHESINQFITIINMIDVYTIYLVSHSYGNTKYFIWMTLV